MLLRNSNGLSDLSIPADDFAALNLPVKRLFITEKTPTTRILPRLDQKETHIYNALINNDWAGTLRLEQEKISFGRLQKALQNMS